MEVCSKCDGKGMWQYDDIHLTVCEQCCRHDKGVWMLTFEYGSADAGKWCCSAGCGTKWAGIMDYRLAVR